MPHTVELSIEPVPGPRPAGRRALFLHGILGSGANLRAIARKFVAARPGWDAVLVDLRGHGSSPKGTPMPSLAAAAADVLGLGGGGLPVAAIVGHSFGGKVALEVLRQGGAGTSEPAGAAPLPLEHVVTLDSNPGPREPLRGGNSALAVLEMLEALPAAFPSKAAFMDAVVGHGHSRALAQWLAMSTAPAPGGGVRFGLDLQEIRELITDYFRCDLWPTVAAPPGGAGVHLVIAERAGSYSAEDAARARALMAQSQRVTVDSLPTDHWVHAEDPEGVLRVLLARIP